MKIVSNNYDDKNIATMELIYGEGYLSAGGAEEVAGIFDGVDVEGKDILDIGCGLGGAAVALAKNHKAGKVYAIDVEESVLARARDLVARESLGNQIKLILVEPGDLQFPDRSFDIVHITAVACHFQNLKPLFSEILRVLKPGGVIVGRDWFKLNASDEFQNWDRLLRDKGLNFYFVMVDVFQRALIDVGFDNVSMTDRSEDMAELARNAVKSVDLELKDKLVTILGREGYEDCRRWTKIRARALTNGGIGQFHFTGYQ
ncbi:MAG: SAM-dependent methyltransferase [Gammaproteobacteria bacterium]